MQKLRIFLATLLLSITGFSVVGMKALAAPRSSLGPIPPQACSVGGGGGGGGSSSGSGSGVAVFSGSGGSSGSGYTGYTGYSGTGGTGGSGSGDENSDVKHRKPMKKS